MKRRKKRPPQVVGRRIAFVDFMGIAVAVAEHDGWLDIVRVYPDGSAESLGQLDRPGTSAEHCLSMMRAAVERAFDLVKEQQRLSRFDRGIREQLERLWDGNDPPPTALGPHENN